MPVGSVAATDWGVDDEGRPTLDLHTPFPGDFSFYALHIESTALDAYYASARFTFKAGCPSDLDCAAPEECLPPPGGGPVIDYLAKDFASFRAALLDYSASAYPQWVERDEPDLGMMLLELLSAAGDDLSYLQDRIANEATLATATQRNSAITPRPARRLRAAARHQRARPRAAGRDDRASSRRAASSRRRSRTAAPSRSKSATGSSTREPADSSAGRWPSTRAGTAASPRSLLWDDSQACLPAGATEMWVTGHGYAFPAGDPQLGTTGLALLIDTAAANPVDPPVREIVHLTAAIEETDALLGQPVTHLRWDATEALNAEHALDPHGARRQPRPGRRGPPLHRGVRHRPRPGRPGRAARRRRPRRPGRRLRRPRAVSPAHARAGPAGLARADDDASITPETC